MFEIKWYVEDESAYDSYSRNLKHIGCPFCRGIGNLNRHGVLKGFGDEQKRQEEVVRGFRVFCSNRGNRQGCGKTHSVLLAKYLYRHSVQTREVVLFFNGLLEGKSLERSWYDSVRFFYVETGRAIWRKFSRTHLGIRSRLFKKQNISSQKEPRLVTWEGIQSDFKSDDPLQDYQLYFQRAFFSSG